MQFTNEDSPNFILFICHKYTHYAIQQMTLQRFGTLAQFSLCLGARTAKRKQISINT